MAAFMVAIALNMFLLASVVLESQSWGAALGIGAFILFAELWFGYPMLTRAEKVGTVVVAPGTLCVKSTMPWGLAPGGRLDLHPIAASPEL
jgi:hypothetical protein